MPVYRLDERLLFPPPEDADESGLLAVGGDLSAERLLLSYSVGIFPWYSEGAPILWHSPDPRMVLLPEELHVSRSLRKKIAKNRFEIRLDTAFNQVIVACAQVPRDGQDGTWITSEMITAYSELHERGYAHSAEAWRDGKLVGGLYGISLGRAFFGESMFANESDASKVAFVSLARWLAGWGVHFIDCQVYTEHLERLGATEWPRSKFLRELRRSLDEPTRIGPWQMDQDIKLGS